MSQTRSYSECQAIVDDNMFARNHDAVEVRKLDEQQMDFYGGFLYRGAIVTFQRVTETVVFEQHRCWKHGYTGQLRDEVISRTEDVQSEETLKLWKTKARGWYWIPVE